MAQILRILVNATVWRTIRPAHPLRTAELIPGPFSYTSQRKTSFFASAAAARSMELDDERLDALRHQSQPIWEVTTRLNGRAPPLSPP